MLAIRRVLISTSSFDNYNFNLYLNGILYFQKPAVLILPAKIYFMNTTIVMLPTIWHPLAKPTNQGSYVILKTNTSSFIAEVAW